MDSSPCIITIDGPAGTGKSSVARLLADRLGMNCLDTGSLYRAIALMAIESGTDAEDGPALAGLARSVQLHFDWSQDPPVMLIDDRDVSTRIRDLDVSALVSPVARQFELREVLNEVQRTIAARRPRLVTEGRDQGSVVFPDADIHFFLDADEEVRAQRRSRQMANRGDKVDPEMIRSDIRRRDETDRSRATAPLVRPEGSILIDSTHLDLEEVVDCMVGHVHQIMQCDQGDS